MMDVAPVLVGTEETTMAMKDNQPVRTILWDDNPIHLKVGNNRPFHSKTAVKVIRVSILILVSGSDLINKQYTHSFR